MPEQEFKVLAGRCHTSSCCPAIMESQASGEIVIVGDALSRLLASPEIKSRIGEGEAAIVIPRAVLLEALKSMNL